MALPEFLTYLFYFFDIFASGGKWLPLFLPGKAVDIQKKNVQNGSSLRHFLIRSPERCLKLCDLLIHSN